MIYEKINGVPKFECHEYAAKNAKYCLLIPIINEGERISNELKRAQLHKINELVDIIICDGNSNDGCTDEKLLRSLGVNTLLIKKDTGKQAAQIRMGFWWAMQRGYKGIISIDGNNKDSIESVPLFINKLDEGYDFIQGSRYIQGGKAINTPFIRHLSVKLLHAPIISLTAKYYFTDTTNAFRGYSMNYLTHPDVQPLREIFVGYELLAYLSVRASQLKMRVCELPVIRAYPKGEKTPTKISFFKGNSDLLKILFNNLIGKYKPA